MTATDLNKEPAAPTPALSDLAKVRAEMDAVVLKPAELVHPLIPAYTLSFRTDLDRAEVDEIRRRCRLPGGKKEINFPKFDGMILAATNIGISKDGVALVDDDGDDVTFGNRTFQQIYEVNTGADCAAAFMRTDSALASFCNAVLERVGFGREVEDAGANPTTSR